MKKFVIDRSIWRTGQDSNNGTGKGETLLLNEHKYMCCLGMYCEQLGIDRQRLVFTGSPASLEMDIPLLTYKSVDEYMDTDFASRAMEINDGDEAESNEERERMIAEHFAKEGIEIEFINQYN
jgi:hypothetical protein